MSEAERDYLRERVATGAATGEERDRLAGMLARSIRSIRAIRANEPTEVEPAVDELLAELRQLADLGSDRSGCTDALAGALLDEQIRALEREDPSDAWRRLDEIRARLLRGGTPDVLHDRLAAALFNTYRGGQLLADEPMRLAALEELRTRAQHDASAGACRVALAELLADEVGVAARRGERSVAESRFAELERLVERDAARASARELARALRELLAAQMRTWTEVLARVEGLVEQHHPGLADPLVLRLAEVLVLAHAEALRDGDPRAAELARARLRELVGLDPGAQATRLLRRELGKALHDAALFEGAEQPVEPGALAELRGLVEHHDDVDLRGLQMSALVQLHREALVRGALDLAADLHADAEWLLARDDAASDGEPASPAGSSGALRLAPPHTPRAARIRSELRVDHLRIVLASHALAGDRGDWIRAEQLLARARTVVERAGRPVELLELLAQLLVNAHVDASSRAPARATGELPAHAQILLDELRELASVHPRSEPLQLQLATALFNAHVEASRLGARSGSIAQTEHLLAELDQLHRDRPELLELRRRLVMAIVNHHGDALEQDHVERAAELLDRLRVLVRSPAADDPLRVQLAMALGNALAHGDDPASPERARIVAELRVLAAREDASEALQTLVLDAVSERFAPIQ